MFYNLEIMTSRVHVNLVHFEGNINICVLCLLDLRFFLVHVHFMICHWYFEFEKRGGVIDIGLLTKLP
jgi:hypothetical protein